MSKIRNTIQKYINWFKSASFKKKAILIVVLCVVLFIIFKPHKKAELYTTDTVKRGTIEDIISESGNITASAQIDVPSVSTGILEELYVNNGDVVSAGQNLFKVKSTASPEQKASAYASYATSLSSEKLSESTKIGLQAQLEKDREAVISAASSVKTMQDNVGASQSNPATQKAYTQNDIDAINSSLTSARETFSQDEKKYLDSDTSINASKAALSSEWLAYQATQDVVITAPIEGVVQNLSYSVGDQVIANSSNPSVQGITSSSSLSTGPVLYIIPNTSSNISLIKVQINEVDFPKVKIGQKATITVPAIQNKSFYGSIVRIDKIGTNTSGVITFNVFIQIGNPDANIAQNMTVNVDIETAKHENVLIVPNSAVKPYKGGKAVQIYDAKKTSPQNIRYVPVKIGIKGTDTTEIISGISVGTTVVTGTTQAKTPGK